MGIINLYFWKHELDKIIRDRTLIRLLNQADVFVEEHASYSGDRKEYLKEQTKVRLEWSNFHVPPRRKTDLIDFLSGSRKLWLIEDTPISCEEEAAIKKLKWKSLEKFYRGNVEESLNLREEFFKKMASIGNRRDEYFSNQLTNLWIRYPCKKILSTRGFLHHYSLSRELSKKNVPHQKFYEPGISLLGLYEQVLLRCIKGEKVDRLEVGRTLVEELMVGYYILAEKREPWRGATERMWKRARSIAEKLDESQINSLSEYIAERVKKHVEINPYNLAAEWCLNLGLGL